MAVGAIRDEQLTALEIALKSAATAGPGAATGGVIGRIETEFCTVWSNAERILRTIGKYIGLIVGVGGTAAAIIIGLVDGGDALDGRRGLLEARALTLS
jgi:hypothetical protein